MGYQTPKVRHMRRRNRVVHAHDLTSFAAAQNKRLSVAGDPGALASAPLTFTGQPTDGQTVTLGARTYTFQATLTNISGNVKIGASAAASFANLAHAVNASGGVAGTDYAAATTQHPTVQSTVFDATHVEFYAKAKGVAGNAYPSTTNVTGATFPGATFSGGTDVTEVVFDTLASLRRGNTAERIRQAASASDLK